MKVDTELTGTLASAGQEGVTARERGYAAVWSTEIAHEPFFPLLLAAQAAPGLEVGTGIAVAFARNPMTIAQAAWDLNAYTDGRFLLGLGSQIKAHIERRYSMPWSHPAARMRELIEALRAIWACWQDGTPLAFEGEFYSHTLMPPFFNPGPIAAGPPRVLVAAVGEGMTRVAAEVADGLLVHGFTTERYLREVTLPLVSATLAARGRSREDFTLVYPAFVVTGRTEAEWAEARRGTRKQIAFYGSTPAYRAVLDQHGWGDLQPELQALSKADRWDDMGALITDEILDAFAVVADPDSVAPLLHKRYGDLITRLRLYLPYEHDTALVDQIAAGVRALGA